MPSRNFDSYKTFRELFWTPVSNKDLSSALDEIGQEVDKRIHQNAAEYKKRGKEDYLLNMFRKKAAKLGRKKWKHSVDIQIANHAMRINPSTFYDPPITGTATRSRPQTVHKKVQKKKKTIVSQKNKKKRKKNRFARSSKEPLVLENDFFRNMRSSLEYFAKKKKEFLLSVLTLYKEMEALDLSDLKKLLEMKFFEVSFKNTLKREKFQQEESQGSLNAEHESGDTKDVEESSMLLRNKSSNASTFSLKETEKEISQSSLQTIDQTPNMLVDLETEKGIDQALSSLIAKKTEIVKMKSKFNMSDNVLKNAGQKSCSEIPQIMFNVGSHTVFKKVQRKS